MADEPKLIVALEARLDRFEKDLRQAGVIAQREIGNIEQKTGGGLERAANAGTIAFNRMGASILGVSTRMVGALGPIAAVAAAVAALGVSANKLGTIVKDLRDVGEAARVPADSVQALQNAFTALGNDAKDAGAVLKTFDAQLTLLRRGQGDLLTTLQRVSPALITQLSAAKTTAEAFDLLVAAYGNLNEEGKRLVSQAAAGALDQQLRKFLSTGQGLAQLTSNLRASGRAIDEATGTKLIALNNQISEATRNIKENLIIALTNLGGIEVLNAIARTAAAIAEITNNIKAFQMTTGREPLRITVTKPQDVAPRLPTAAEQLATLKPIVEFLGEAATRSQLFAVAQLQLKAAMEANQSLAPQYKRALEGVTVALNANVLAARQAAGIATEQEIVQQRLAEAYLKRNTGIIQSDAELAAAEAKIRKEAREFLQQQEAAASRLPNVTKTLQDLGTMSKQLDAIGLRSADHFADGILAIADGSKKAKDAFADMAKSIINDMAKMALRRVFLQGFTGIFGGGPATPGLAAGGPAQAGQPYIVGERGPELFVPNQSGTVVPNNAMRRGGGGTTFAPTTIIDARGSSMDESQFRQILAVNNRALMKQIDRALPARQQRMQLLGT